MKVSLLHPSRSRPEKSYNNCIKWKGRAKTHEVELILSVDKSDPKLSGYYDYYALPGNPLWTNKGVIYENENNSVVDATNKAARISTGEILVYLSDDFECPVNWDEMIVDEFKDENRPLLIKVDDCLQPLGTPVLTIPIMNRALYEKLGYFWHPGYKSMFVDEDLYWTAKKIGALKNAEHLKFPHLHPSNGKAQNDETYKRSAANWDQGKEFFAKRRGAGFPI